ncbi:hypothetical protein [Promicromonospora sp. NFX87]|uniref:VG15 protein n=1 Tax=Promicromonospora sp. NFX87 TaxID=3402691 RepID=UPI003AFB2B8F
MPTPAEVAQFAAANQTIVRMVNADLASFWATLPLRNPDTARDMLLEFVPILVAQYGEIAADAAAEWFEQLRDQAAGDGLFRAVGVLGNFRARALDPLESVPPVATESTVRFAAGGLYRPDEATRPKDMPATPEQTLKMLRGALQKQVLQPGRDTLVANTNRDRAAYGWGRFVRPGACKFCRMLSGRGGVYTEISAAFDAHDGECLCVVGPTWDQSAPKADVRAEFVASTRTTALRLQAERGDAAAAAKLAEYRTRLANYLEELPEDAGVTYDATDDDAVDGD